MEGHDIVALVAGVGASAELGANEDLGGKPYYRDSYAVRYEIGDGVVDIPWVAGHEGAVYDEHFSSAV